MNNRLTLLVLVVSFLGHVTGQAACNESQIADIEQSSMSTCMITNKADPGPYNVPTICAPFEGMMACRENVTKKKTKEKNCTVTGVTYKVMLCDMNSKTSLYGFWNCIKGTPHDKKCITPKVTECLKNLKGDKNETIPGTGISVFNMTVGFQAEYKGKVCPNSTASPESGSTTPGSSSGDSTDSPPSGSPPIFHPGLLVKALLSLLSLGLARI